MPRYWLCFVSSLTILALSLFVITPFLNRHWGETTGNSAFMILRLFGWMAIGFAFTRWVKSTRFQAIMATVMIGMFDSVVFKGIGLLHDRHVHPDHWVGIEPFTMVFGLAMSSVLFLPIVLMLSFMGCLIGAKTLAPRV